MQDNNNGFWRSELKDWLSLNGKLSKSIIGGHPPWKILYSFVVWLIWKSKNNYVFNGKLANPRLATEITNQAMEFMYCYSSSKASNGRTSKLVRWEKPPSGWTKSNTDGASLGDSGVAGCGGIVRDEKGNWVAGFTRRIGITNSFKAELWGLQDGLTMCSNLNISSLIVELDAKVVVDIFHNVNYENIVLSPILDDCRHLMSRFD